MAENPPAATPTAQAHAAELGVDLSTVEGTGAGGKITKADVAAAAEQPSNWFYSLDPKHVANDLLDERRFFQWDAPEDNPQACPEENGKQVNAVPVPAKGAYPTSVLEIAARLAQR